MAILKAPSRLKEEAEARHDPRVKGAIKSSSGGLRQDHDTNIPKLGGLTVKEANAMTAEEIRERTELQRNNNNKVKHRA